MATRDELQAQEDDCANASEYAALADKALQEPADVEYAKELLAKGEMSCSFPADYLRIAEVALAAGDKDKAAELYEEAEGMCFEAKEKAQVGYSLALNMGDKENGRRLLEAAVSETTDQAELLTYAGYIKQALADQALEKSIFDKVTGSCKSLEEYKALAGSIKDRGDADTARLVYEKAAVLNDGVEDIPVFAQGIAELFEDESWVEQTLSAAEGDCMFPGQFVALARGYQELLDNKDKAAELLEQGKQFAMSGQENLDLANGYAALLGDQETAQGLYQQALSDLTTKDELLALAAAIARHLDDKALAIATYDKVEEKLASAADFMLLAQAVNDDLGDKERVAQIYARSQARLETPAELISLAAAVRSNLADADSIRNIQSKALENSKAYNDVVKLLDDFGKVGGDDELIDQALGKAMDLSEETAQMLDLAKRSSQLPLNDNRRLMQALDKAEENVSSLDEMRKLSNAVKQYAAEDEQRGQRIAEKLEKREQSQARYLDFQKQEKTFSRPPQFIGLAYDVTKELEDPSYASQLLATAEEKMRESTYSLNGYLPLIVAVDNLTKDRVWTERLLDQAAQHCQQFAAIKAVGDTVSYGLSDSEFGKQWLDKFYASCVDRLQANVGSPFEFLKMARAVKQHLGDEAWATKLLDAAVEHADTHFHYSYIAEQAGHWGDADRAAVLYAQAAAACSDARSLQQLVLRMRAAGVAEAVQRELYARGDGMTDGLKKLRWIEGIVTLFKDTGWAEQAYQQLQNSFTEGEGKRLFELSRENYLKPKRFY